MNSCGFPVEISACLSIYLDWAADMQYRAVFPSRVNRYWKKHTRFEQNLVSERYGRKELRCNGKLHCESGPAVTYPGGTTEWYLHRVDGSTITYPDVTTEWYLNGIVHRIDGPAITWADGSTEWYLNGKRHRVDGPALTYPDGSTSWWINGQRVQKRK